MFRELQLGDIGDSVEILQEKLKILGFYSPIITGSFGPATEVGVKAFQKENNLEETGIVTQETWNLLIDATEPAINPISVFPTLSYGSSGNYVTDLQTKLKALLYYTGNITGTFDKETETAVKRFQLNNELTATGIVNNQTWNLLNSLYGNLNVCVLDEDKNEETDNNTLTYTVVNGDTLYSIANRYNTTVNAIKQLNHLTSNTLQIGQILKIPMSVQEGYIQYTVSSGDTLYAIARRYDTTVDEIKKLNNLTSNTLQIGQILNIPTRKQEDFISYVVQRNDTLYSIASQYNTTVNEIKQLNNLTSNLLQIGQVLKIPTTSTDYIIYTVTNGDTLYSIARRYDTTINEIKSINNLTSNTLRIGQTIKIPVS